MIATLFPVAKSIKIDIWSYDKIGHFFMFGLWTFLFGIATSVKKQQPPNLWMVFLVGSFFGLTIEVLQFILPTSRSPEVMDFIADILGSGLAILLLKALMHRFFKVESITT